MPESIRKFNPEAKLIYIMRDPVARTISHYWHQVGLRKEHRAPLEAIRRDTHYCEVSNYAYQLKRYFNLFPEEQLLTITWELLTAQPASTMSAVFEWLGLGVPDNLNEHWEPRNVTPPLVPKIRGSGVLYHLRMSKFGRVLSRCLPTQLRGPIRAATETQVDRAGVDTRRVTLNLQDRQQDETCVLQELLGRDFPEGSLLWGDSQ